MRRGPFEITSGDDIRFGFRRFPREQKAGKVRMIDPAVGACECSLLNKVVPIPAAQDILINAAVARDPQVRGLHVVQHTRRPVKGEVVEFNDECGHVQKKRRRDNGEKVDLEIVVVDVAKCYKNMMAKLNHRVYNRLIAYDPNLAKYFWFESLTAIFGSKHSVTGWARQGDEPEVFLTEGKKKLIKETRERVLTDGVMEPDELEAFVGRLTFALGYVEW
eukprot:g19176.t1